jgi:ABC-2 type transport system permease protein
VSLLTIAAKDLRLIVRDRPALLFVMLVPIAVITVIAESLAGTDSGGLLVLPVVNEDEGPVAEVLIEILGEHTEVSVVDREEAERLVSRDKRAAAALLLPGKLSKNYLASRPSTLELWTDPAKGREVQAAKAYLMLADKEAAELADPLFEQLLVLDERNLTGTRASIPPFEQHVPGFSVMFVLMGVLFGVAFGLRDERDWGAANRLRIAPISPVALLGGKLLARFAVGVVQLAVLFGFGRLVFGMSLGAAPAALLLLGLAIVFSMTGFSLLVSAFARTREQIVPLGLTTIMIICALGGCWWPLYQEPDWLQSVAYFTLTAWSMDGIHDVILRDRGLLEIAPTLAVLIAYGAICALIGARIHRFEN